MKKTFILIILATIIALIIIYENYSLNMLEKKRINEINSEFVISEKENTKVQINKIVTLMNKAISINRKNNIKQDEKDRFIENDTNSIKIYLETRASYSTDEDIQLVQVPMEDLMLNEKAGPETVESVFSDLTFKVTETEYHQKTGQIKKIVFSEII